MSEYLVSGLAIVGHQRSGTTLLRRVLNSHPETAVTIEFGCYMKLDQSFAPYARDVLERWLRRRNNPFFNKGDEGRRRLKGENFVDNSVLVGRYLWYLGFSHLGVVVEEGVTAALSSLFPEATLVGDKHPDYWFLLDELASRELLIVAVYRDPRDMVSSVLVKARGDWRAYWPPELRSAANVAKRWVAFMDALERNREELQPVCYEELVTDSARVMTEIGTYLDLDPDGFNLAGINASSIGKYRQGLTSQELREVLDVAEDSMIRYGYEV